MDRRHKEIGNQEGKAGSTGNVVSALTACIMRTGIKALFLVTGIIFSLVICLVIGLHIYVKTGSAQKLVLAKINEFIPGSLSWQELRSSLLKGQLEIVAGVLADPEGKELVRVDDLVINLAWYKIITGELVIEKAHIAAPLVDLGLDRDGNLALVRAVYSPGTYEPPAGKEKQGFPFNVVVAKLTLSDGTVLYQAGDGSSRAEVSGIDLTANADLFAEVVDFAARVARASYTGGKIQADLQKFLAGASLRKDVIAPIFVQAETGFSQVSMKGSIKDISGKPYFTLAADVSVSLPELSDVLGLHREFTGRAETRIEAEGNLDNPDVHVHLVYGGGLLAGQRLDAAALDINLNDKVLALDDAHVEIASGDVFIQGLSDLNKVFPHGFFSENRDPDAISYEFSAKGARIDLAKLLPEKNSMQGIIAPAITLSGTGISPKKIIARMSAELVCKKLVIGEAVLPVDILLRSSVRIKEGIVRVLDLDALSGRNMFAAAGWVDLSCRELDARMELDVPDLKGELAPLGIDGNGRIGLVAHVSKTLDAPQIEVDLDAKQIRYGEVTLGDIVCTADLDQSGILKISRFALENRGSKIHGSGSVRIYEKFTGFTAENPVNFSAVLTNAEVRDFMDSRGLTGMFSGEVFLGGTLSFPDARLVLNGKDLAIGGARIGDVEVQSSFERGTLILEKAFARNRNSRLFAAGTIKVFDQVARDYLKDPLIRITLKGDGVFLEDVYQGYAGKLSLQGSVEGSIRHPKGVLNLAGEEIDLGFQKIDKVVLASSIDGERFVVDALNVFLAEDEMIAGTGWVSLQKEYAFHLASQGISLQSIHALEGNKAARGRVRLDMSGQGSLDNPSLKGEAALRGFFMQENAPEDEMVVLIDLKDHEARISGNLDFEFSGSYHLDEKDFSFSAVFDHADLSPYFVLAGKPGLKGAVDGRIEAKGNTQDSRNLQAFMDLTHLDIFFKDNEIIRSDDFKASITGAAVSIPQAHIILGKHGWVDINGTGEFHGGVLLNASGDIPLQVLGPFVKDIEAIEGRVLFTALVEDSGNKREIRSDITLQGLGMKVPYIEERLHSTSGRITITPQMVLFEKIEGRLGEGGFNLAGKMELKDLIPERIGFKLNARSLPVRIPDTLDLYADLDVQLEGTPEKSIMHGKAILLEGTYYRDIKLNLIKGLRTIVEKRPQGKSPRKRITIPFLGNMDLDISVKRRNPLYVDNNVAQLDINPDLLITGTLNNPVINGRASIVSGAVEFRNRTFTVTKGVVDFLNPYKSEAVIDLVSEVKVRDWMIYLGISGTPEALKLSLRSDPPEEDNDILSLLVLGKTSRELIAGEGGSTQSTSAMIATLVASRYGEDFKEATGLDILEIESGTGREDSADAVKVTIGKELSRRMTLKYAMESKNSELSQRAVAEYKLLENILVNGFQDTRGIFGADVQLRLEFR